MDKITKSDKVGVVTILRHEGRAAQRTRSGGRPAGDDERMCFTRRASLEAVRRSECRKDSRSDAWVGVPIAIALGIDRDSDKGLAQRQEHIKEWLRQGKLVEEIRRTGPDSQRHTSWRL